MRWAPVALGLLLALSLASAVGVQAQKDTDVRLIAHDDASNCVADRAPCYEAPNDSWTLVEEGSEIAVTFENNASTAHTLNIAAGANASEDRNTSRSAAFATIGPIEPGETVNATVEIPVGTDTAYLYCHLGDHEADGLHLLRNVYPAGSVEEASKTGPGLDEPNESPAPLGLVLAGLAATALRRRR